MKITRPNTNAAVSLANGTRKPDASAAAKAIRTNSGVIE